jgi:hypothetical protein
MTQWLATTNQIATYSQLGLGAEQIQVLPRFLHVLLRFAAFCRVESACLHVGAASEQGVVNEQNDDCPDYSDQDAVKIYTSHAHVAKGVEEPATENSPHDS